MRYLLIVVCKIDGEDGYSVDEWLFFVNLNSVICVWCSVVDSGIFLVDLFVSSFDEVVINSVCLVEAEVKFVKNAIMVTEHDVVTEENWVNA